MKAGPGHPMPDSPLGSQPFVPCYSCVCVWLPAASLLPWAPEWNSALSWIEFCYLLNHLTGLVQFFGLVLVFSRQCLSVVRHCQGGVSLPWLSWNSLSVNQADLEFIEICLSLPPKPWRLKVTLPSGLAHCIFNLWIRFVGFSLT